MPQEQRVPAPVIAITPSKTGSGLASSSDESDDAGVSQLMTPTASTGGRVAGDRVTPSAQQQQQHLVGPSLSASISPESPPTTAKRPKPLKRLSGLPKGLKLNLKKGSNRSAAPSDPQSSPLGLLCLRVIAARNLTSKDRNGKSDPWLLVKLGDCRTESEVVKASLNPVWGELDGVGKNVLQPDGHVKTETVVVAPVWTETMHLTRVEIVAWDKDTFSKDDYLGEVCFGLDEWAACFGQNIPVAYDAPENQPIWRTVTSSKSKTKVSGEILVKLGWIAAPDAELDRVMSNRSRKSVTPEPEHIALTTKTTALIAESSASKYASMHPLTERDKHDIKKAMSERLPLTSDVDPADLSDTGDVKGKASGSSGVKRGWGRLRRKKRQTLQERQERVWAAPPTEGVGTLRLDQETRVALSNELAGGANTGYSSDSSSPMEDYDEEDGSDAGVFSRDDASGTSEASSVADPEERIDEEYFDLALGMQDAPKDSAAVGDPSQDMLKPGADAPEYASMPSTPGLERKKKTGFSNLFKRSASSKSVDKIGKSSLIPQPQYAVQDGSVSDSGPSEPPSGAATPGAYRRRKFTRRKVYLEPGDSTDVGAVNLVDQKRKKHKKHSPKTGRRRKTSQPSITGPGGYSISTGAAQDDYLGVVFIEVKGANNLPRWRNMTRTGWDMDPFCIVSFGQKVFRTRVIRHSRNPVWDERLFFHVKRHEHAFQILFTLFDWDKISSNDFVGEVPFLLSDLTSKAPKPDPQNGVFATNTEGKVLGDDLYDYTLILGSKSAELEDSSKTPTTLTIRAKFTPYSALRQRFWRTYLKQYDTDDSETWSYVELYSLLDSLGATLTRATIDTFFTRFGKTAEDTLTADEAVICLEDELTKPRSEKREVEATALDYSASRSGVNTPYSTDSPGSISLSQNAGSGSMDFTGHAVTGEPEGGAPAKETPVSDTAALGVPGNHFARTNTSGSSLAFTPASRQSSTSSSTNSAAESLDNIDSQKPHELERVINIRTCPLCHKKLSKKAEVDMVSHLAVCASQDWSSLDSLTVANFVSTSQAHRKWFTKMVTKISHGSYKLGADSANILVQDRMTGQLLEEKMQVYVRLGIRLWYRAAGSSSRMEANRIRKLLRSMTMKQGAKFDAPESVAEIPRFIAYHRLDMKEVLDPIESFQNFNSFFYRKLKPDARPVADPDDPRTLVSSADCRMTAFQTVNEATTIWIKGRTFSIRRLLGEAFKDDAAKFEGGSLCIFRLAPQDYHRYHSPVDGVVGRMNEIAGEYYTVNPIAIRSNLDVYAENARVIVPMDSPAFGRVYNACIGAMMVGSIRFTKKEGESVKRGEEYGYFAFGGSTIVCLFEPGTVQFDDDILQNSAACIETLVRVGMRIGRSTRKM